MSSTSWDPERYATNARFVSDLGAPLLDRLAPRPRERILDLGCGDGALTERIAALECTVVAIDSSLAQLQAARQRGLQVVLMDGQEMSFKRSFDAVFTNAALHWMKRPDRVVSGVWNILKPGGRFLGEFGGKGNVEKIRSALYAALEKRAIEPAPIDPWYYPSADEYAQLLTGAGFSISSIELIPRSTRLPGDMRAWLELFAQPFIAAVAEFDRPAFLDELTRSLEPDLRAADGQWFADYVRLRFAVTKPAT
jgi:trans-aconitate methyltransferase